MEQERQELQIKYDLKKGDCAKLSLDRKKEKKEEKEREKKYEEELAALKK